MRAVMEMVPVFFTLVVSFACLCLSIPSPLFARPTAGTSVAVPDVYWNGDLESLMPALLFNSDSGKKFMSDARTKRVASLQKGCGRMKNRLAVFEDGTRVCCRYRDSLRDLRGDVYAYYFSGLLGLWNTPPVAVVTADFNSEQWKSVVAIAKEAGWMNGGYLIMSLFIDGLSGEYIPKLLREKHSELGTKSLSAANHTGEENIRLMQWSDMIVFDFLSGHMDRIFNTLANLQWNSKMMDKTVHNLEKTDSGTLVLLDNESTFWMGYVSGRKKSSNYDIQIEFLKRTCLFRKKTIEAVSKLLSSGRPDVILEEYIKASDPYSYETMPKLNSWEREDFKSRLETVLEHIQLCMQ